MKLAWCLWSVLAAAPVASAAPADWVALFDSKSMAGWEDPRQKGPPGDAWTIAFVSRLWLTVLEAAPGVVFLLWGGAPRPPNHNQADSP